MIFNNAQQAFEYYYNEIKNSGINYRDTKTLFNQGFTIKNPLDNHINTEFRSWNLNYAKAEFEWYLSGDRNLSKLEEYYGLIPKIWQSMSDDNGDVNSNYGWQWNRSEQLKKIIDIIKEDLYSRRASISIYDAKEINTYSKDTPCTYAVNFYYNNDSLNMSVMMRSNDLWFGFCNDQYCFSELQRIVAKELNLKVGEYFHFVNNLHLYNRNIF